MVQVAGESLRHRVRRHRRTKARLARRAFIGRFHAQTQLLPSPKFEGASLFLITGLRVIFHGRALAGLILRSGVSSLVAAMRRAVLIPLVRRVHILCHNDTSPLPANALLAFRSADMQ
jgi:hypothetical protein